MGLTVPERGVVARADGGVTKKQVGKIGDQLRYTRHACCVYCRSSEGEKGTSRHRHKQAEGPSLPFPVHIPNPDLPPPRTTHRRAWATTCLTHSPAGSCCCRATTTSSRCCCRRCWTGWQRSRCVLAVLRASTSSNLSRREHWGCLALAYVRPWVVGSLQLANVFAVNATRCEPPSTIRHKTAVGGYAAHT